MLFYAIFLTLILIAKLDEYDNNAVDIEYKKEVDLIKPVENQNPLPKKEDIDVEKEAKWRKTKPLIVHKARKNEKNLTYFISKYNHDDGVSSKGMLLDIFYNERDLTMTQTKALILIMIIGLLFFLSLLIFTCCLKTLFGCTNKKTKKAQSIDTLKTIDFHRGGGGI